MDDIKTVDDALDCLEDIAREINDIIKRIKQLRFRGE